MNQNNPTAQTDHDKLVEYGVMLQTIMSGLTRLEQQIKDLIQGQAASLASWEASSKAIHDDQEKRIRKIEDLAIQYVPIGDDLVKRMGRVEGDIQQLKDNKIEIIGGWKTVMLICGSIAGFLSFLYLLFNLISSGCKILLCR